MPNLFISHSEVDGPVVKALTTLLISDSGIAFGDIFATSIEGAGIEAGLDFKKRIRKRLLGADCAILILSPNYYASLFCVAEMGAAWAVCDNIFPLMLPGTTRNPLGVLSGRQSYAVDAEGLGELTDTLKVHWPELGKKQARWDAERDGFLKSFKRIARKLKKPALVDREDHEALRAKYEAAQSLIDDERRLREKAETRAEKLKKLKDVDEVSAVMAEDSTVSEAFEAALERAHKELSKLGAVEQRAIYAGLSGSPWRPADTDWQSWGDAIREAEDRKHISDEHGDGDGPFWADTDHPAMEEASSALDELKEVMSWREFETDVAPQLIRTYKCTADLTDKTFFEKVVLEDSLIT